MSLTSTYFGQVTSLDSFVEGMSVHNSQSSVVRVRHSRDNEDRSFVVHPERCSLTRLEAAKVAVAHLEALVPSKKAVGPEGVNDVLVALERDFFHPEVIKLSEKKLLLVDKDALLMFQIGTTNNFGFMTVILSTEGVEFVDYEEAA